MKSSGVRKQGKKNLINKAAGKQPKAAVSPMKAIVELERALRESEQRFKVITEAMPVMVWMAGTDKLCTYFNKSWLDFVGRTLEQEWGNGWAENVHPDDFERCLQIYVTSFDAHQPFEMHYRLRHHSGEFRWILDHGVPRYASDGTFEGYVGGCLDIHEQKQAAEKMNAAFLVSQRLAAIVDSSNDAIVSKDLNGIVTSWNPAAERIFGYTPEEMIGHSIRKVIPPELQHDEERILASISRGERIEHFQTVRLTKSGKRLEVSLTISPVKDGSGRIVGAAKIARDITEQKKAEHALRTTEKLASVGKLAATVAHEINNPLEAVTNLVYLAREHAVRDDVRQFLAVAEQELDRVAHITKQTLGFYRDTTKPSAVRIGELLNPLVAVFASRSRNKGVEISPEILDDPVLYAAAGEIRQLIANLLSNSIDAVPSGGQIRIRVSGHTERTAKPVAGVRITIADSGPGIPAEDRQHLFEPFFTTKKEVGTGLGLWV
ncbi:MAG TPA: PAS domain S-box protein, partial [Terriglobales bacterium]|nr:PAS domain S-box protein [Terriglobales bacterium]